jgi:hypothetical protein
VGSLWGVEDSLSFECVVSDSLLTRRVIEIYDLTSADSHRLVLEW